MSTPVPPPRLRPARFRPIPRELIVVVRPEAGLDVSGTPVASTAAADHAGLAEVVRSAGARIHPLFGPAVEAARNDAASAVAVTPAPRVPGLALFYRVEAPEARLDALAQSLRRHPAVDSAYVKPAAVPPLMYETVPSSAPLPAVTPDFTSRQGYLERAPGGVDARYAWLHAGGQGGNVRIVDVEYAWRFTHEDLIQAQGGVVGGVQPFDLGLRNHGTGVIGVFSGDRNPYGVTGICPSAVVSGVSASLDLGLTVVSVARGIQTAADHLLPGDVLLIELHAPGPRYQFQPRNDQRGYIPIEWWPCNFRAIHDAVERGVIVVEAAGNGTENLDDAIYDARPPEQCGTLPTDWVNPFRRTSHDSGAILVGAGAPPPGTHGYYAGPDRSRLDFSNYGACVDAQGWGLEVTTCGSGDLQRGLTENRWYTDGFNGTSSAAPIVAGVAAALQGALRGAGKAPLTPAEMRTLLRVTGSPQQDAPGRPASQRIGNRPDLRQAIDRLLAPSPLTFLYRYYNTTAGDHFYTTHFSELQTGRQGYAYEGVQCQVYAEERPGTLALHRYFNAETGDHFYTSSYAELESGNLGYVHEGVEGYVPAERQPGTVALYRYYNAAIADHFYTTVWEELRWGILGSWILEGRQCWVFPAPIAAAAAEAAPDVPAVQPLTAVSAA